jgi:hypothetical protein
VTAIYGSIVIHGGYVCDNMKNTGLWVWAHFLYYSSIIFCGAFVISLVIIFLTRVTSDSDGGENAVPTAVVAIATPEDEENFVPPETALARLASNQDGLEKDTDVKVTEVTAVVLEEP